MICCPLCKSGGYTLSNSYMRCRTCGHRYLTRDGIERQRLAHQGPKFVKQPKEKYKGKPAGKIVYPGYVYGASRLG